MQYIYVYMYICRVINNIYIYILILNVYHLDRTYVTAGLIPKKDFIKGLYWDTKDPYHYVRCTEYNDTHYLLISGGEDHKSGFEVDKAKLEEKYRNLHEWALKRWPTLGPALFKWSGHVRKNPFF